MKVVFSTYQSLERISEAQKIFGDDFDLIICDEAHRTTGYGEKSTEFTAVHDQNFIRGKKRLYMTATPRLENRISETYAKKTAATNKNSLYDSYIKAFRWASDRIDEGIIGFVTNAGWLDGATMDGLRKCFGETRS